MYVCIAFWDSPSRFVRKSASENGYSYLHASTNNGTLVYTNMVFVKNVQMALLL